MRAFPNQRGGILSRRFSLTPMLQLNISSKTLLMTENREENDLEETLVSNQ